MRSLCVLIATLLLTAVPSIASAIPDIQECSGEKIMSTYIGKDKNVLAEVVQCDGAEIPDSRILPRQSNNVCGAQCEFVSKFIFNMLTL
jgi:hypothetical protein